MMTTADTFSTQTGASDLPTSQAKDKTAYSFADAAQDVADGKSLDESVSSLLVGLTQDERLWLLDGDSGFYDGLRTMFQERYNIRPFIMGSIPRVKIPGIRFTDGPRGVCVGESTTFPVSMARGATFDVDLERRIGVAIGKEAKAHGANFYAGVCINLPRHPAWGRSQETYSEDSLLLGAFGSALTTGVQENVMACVKHFALNSMENARFRVDVKVDDSALHEVYLPHFKRVIDAGVASVMSAYNAVNGEWAGQSRLLLIDILRSMWKFDGFVMSDFVFGLRDPALSLKNGLDIEAPFRQQRALHLKRSIQQEEASWEDVNQAAQRLLRKQLQFHLTTKASRPDPSVVLCDEHKKLAREAAARAVVLLRNEEVNGIKLLPLDTRSLNTIAIIGRLARTQNTGDLGSSRVVSPHVVTLAEGLAAALPAAKIVIDDSDSVDNACAVALAADLVICIVGYSASDEGEYVIPSLQQDPALRDLLPIPHGPDEEKVAATLRGDAQSGSETGLAAGAGGDRMSLRLRQRDQEIVTAVANTKTPTIMSVVCAGAVLMDDLISKVPATVISWYGGCEGGHGLADVLLGKQDASGRLPFSIPKSEKHLPFFQIDAKEITYDRWHGQRLLDRLGFEASYAFGYGLSYTTFQWSDLAVSINTHAKDMHEALLIDFDVANVGKRAGRFVAQAYALPGLDDFPSRVLVGFQPVDLEAGQTARVSLVASTQPLSRWIDGEFVLPGKDVEFEISAFAGNRNASKVWFKL